MIFELRWSKIARDELARIWITADSELRKQITQSSYRLEMALKKSPHEVGESRDGSRRVDFDFPLGIAFRVIDEKRRVNVLHVWKIGKRPAS
jgi:hypothetical protein